MTEAEVRDELKTLPIGGHETVAAVLAWAFDRLHRQPEVMHADEPNYTPCTDVPTPMISLRLPYLSVVCSEALRLYPVVPAVSRRPRQPLGCAATRYLPASLSEPRFHLPIAILALSLTRSVFAQNASSNTYIPSSICRLEGRAALCGCRLSRLTS